MTELIGEGPPTQPEARRGGGLLAVAVGLGLFGASTFGFVSFAGKALGAVEFAPLGVLFTLLNALAIGIFLPFEQELGRITAMRRALGEGNRSYARSVVKVALALLGGFALVALAAGPFLSSRLLGGHGELVVLLVLAMAGMAGAYVIRGLLAGQGRFGRYGAQLAADGALRIAATGLLYATGVDNVTAYALVLVVSPVVSVLVTTPRLSGLVVPGGQDVAGPAVARAVATLIGASVLSQALAQAGPIIVQFLASPSEAKVSSQFVAAIAIARVPLFAFAIVQAVFLPGLAGLVSTGDGRGFRRTVDIVAVGTLVIGAAGVLAVWLVGPEILLLLFTADFSIDRAVFALMALSGALLMLAQVATQALLALHADRAVMAGWGIGLVALVIAAAVPGGLAARAAWALVVGSAAAFVLLAGLLVVRRARWRASLAAPAGDRAHG